MKITISVVANTKGLCAHIMHECIGKGANGLVPPGPTDQRPPDLKVLTRFIDMDHISD